MLRAVSDGFDRPFDVAHSLLSPDQSGPKGSEEPPWASTALRTKSQTKHGFNHADP